MPNINALLTNNEYTIIAVSLNENMLHCEFVKLSVRCDILFFSSPLLYVSSMFCNANVVLPFVWDSYLNRGQLQFSVT